MRCLAQPRGLKSSPPSSATTRASPAPRCSPADMSSKAVTRVGKKMENTENASTPSSSARAPSAGFSRRAVIDIGTNSVKLLVAEVSGRRVHPLLERSEQTRLGRGFYATHRLQPAAIADTARAVAGFAAQAREWGAVPTRVIATSAARDAINQSELLAALQSASNLEDDVISGEQEADWAFRGVNSDPAFAGQPLILVDVGGRSTACIPAERNHR